MSFTVENKPLVEAMAVIRDRIGPDRFRFLLEMPEDELLAFADAAGAIIEERKTAKLGLGDEHLDDFLVTIPM